MKHDAHLRKQLEKILSTQPHSLRAEVAQEALDAEDIACFFSELLQHGCQSGLVSGLIYYYDTHRFYDKHYDEIEMLRFELEESMGEQLHPKGDLKNWFAWFAFEETACQIADELNAYVKCRENTVQIP